MQWPDRNPVCGAPSSSSLTCAHIALTMTDVGSAQATKDAATIAQLVVAKLIKEPVAAVMAFK